MTGVLIGVKEVAPECGTVAAAAGAARHESSSLNPLSTLMIRSKDLMSKEWIGLLVRRDGCRCLDSFYHIGIYGVYILPS